MTNDRVSFDKLTIDNYSAWKFQMKLYLNSKGLFSIVDKSEGEPEDQTENAEYLERAERAFTIIGLSVSSSLVYRISDSLTASDAWAKL